MLPSVFSSATAPMKLFYGIQGSRYAHLSAGCIIIWDHLATFDQEVSLIWPGSLSIGKALFLLSRYYALAATFFDLYGFFSSTKSNMVCGFVFVSMYIPSCTHFYQWQGWTSLVITVIAQGILQLRIYALYAKNKTVLTVMLLLFICSLSSAAVFMATGLWGLKGISLPILELGEFCLYDSPKSIHTQYRFWVPGLLFDAFLSALATYKSFGLRKSLGGLSTFRQSGEQLVDVLFRDSVVYFLAISLTYLTCMLTWMFGDRALTETPLGFAIAFPCVISNRMVLNLRGVHRTSEGQSHIPFTTMGYDTSPSFGFQVPHSG